MGDFLGPWRPAGICCLKGDPFTPVGVSGKALSMFRGAGPLRDCLCGCFCCGGEGLGATCGGSGLGGLMARAGIGGGDEVGSAGGGDVGEPRASNLVFKASKFLPEKVLDTTLVFWTVTLLEDEV